MGQEQQPSPLRHIHVDLENWSVILEGADGRAISFNPRDLLAQLATSLPSSESPTFEAPVTETQERQQQVYLTGKLKTKPKEGNPDSRGRPTATARLAVHEDGIPYAKMYFATFHGGSREIALRLPEQAPISVLGYPHPAKDPDSLDTFSVMRITTYPGKPAPSKDANRTKTH